MEARRFRDRGAHQHLTERGAQGTRLGPQVTAACRMWPGNWARAPVGAGEFGVRLAAARNDPDRALSELIVSSQKDNRSIVQ